MAALSWSLDGMTDTGVKQRAKPRFDGVWNRRGRPPTRGSLLTSTHIALAWIQPRSSLEADRVHETLEAVLVKPLGERPRGSRDQVRGAGGSPSGLPAPSGEPVETTGRCVITGPPPFLRLPR